MAATLSLCREIPVTHRHKWLQISIRIFWTMTAGIMRLCYSGKGADSIEASKEAAKEAAPLPSNVDPELLAKILANPEMAALLTSLAKSIR